VAGDDHDALDAKIQSLRQDARKLAGLARLVGWSNPRPDRSTDVRIALELAAAKVLAGAGTVTAQVACASANDIDKMLI
jgi:hypothetical protein